MKVYKVTLLKKGQREDVFLKAENKAEAIKQLKGKGIVIKAEESEIPLEDKIKELGKILKTTFSKKKLNYPIFISAIRQLGALTKASISIKDSLENIAQNTTDSLIKEIFTKAAEDIDAGLSLSNTFEEYELYIGNLAVALVKLGEKTGELGEAFMDMADIYENMEENRQKFKSALRYPIMTLSAMAIAFTILILYVIPKFKSIFSELHSELPLPTKILLDIEYVLRNYGLFLLAILLMLFIIHKYLYRINATYKYYFDGFLLKMKIIGPIIEYASLSRFLIVLTKLVKTGIPLIEALTIANTIIDNAVLNLKIDNIIKAINQGQSLTSALEKEKLLDNITLQMISAGEESGNLDSMLENASEYYKTQFDIIVDTLGDAIEPILMAFIGALVLLIALGIFLPMWDLAKAAKT
jgi:general secretion pathway protein F